MSYYKFLRAAKPRKKFCTPGLNRAIFKYMMPSYGGGDRMAVSSNLTMLALSLEKKCCGPDKSAGNFDKHL